MKKITISNLNHFSLPIFLSGIALITSFIVIGASSLFTILILIAIELTFSFDNSIVNAKILNQLSQFWRIMFLTIGIFIAVIGMRFIFPIIIVMVASNQSWSIVVSLAFHHPDQYSTLLRDAHYQISYFGGTFLLLVGLDFFFDKSIEVFWNKRIEKIFKFFGHLLSPYIFCLVVLVILFSLTSIDQHRHLIEFSIYGVLVHILIKVILYLSGLLNLKQSNDIKIKGFSALITFIYLEILDASFSLDGVVGAFAITKNIILVAIGLGVGALWVRSLTTFLIKKDTLNHYIYLEHGAYYAILSLGVIMLLGTLINIPQYMPGCLGIALIGLAFLHSKRHIKAI